MQRIFELAMAMRNYNEPVLYQGAVEIEAWGYKTTAPEGTEQMNAVFYTIVEAKIWDEDLSSVVLQPWMVSMY